jgi:hypothetical protein
LAVSLGIPLPILLSAGLPLPVIGILQTRPLLLQCEVGAFLLLLCAKPELIVLCPDFTLGAGLVFC